MEYITATARLYLRKINEIDTEDLFEMDADPAVHRFIENQPVHNRSQLTPVIAMLSRQYLEYGIARWAVVDKETHECIGWAGLKYFPDTFNKHQGFYELGYRFKRKHWGKGYATEASEAVIKYGFQELGLHTIYAITHPENKASINVLKKLGFSFIEVFDYDGDPTNWFELTKETYIKKPH